MPTLWASGTPGAVDHYSSWLTPATLALDNLDQQNTSTFPTRHGMGPFWQGSIEWGADGGGWLRHVGLPEPYNNGSNNCTWAHARMQEDPGIGGEYTGTCPSTVSGVDLPGLNTRQVGATYHAWNGGVIYQADQQWTMSISGRSVRLDAITRHWAFPWWMIPGFNTLVSAPGVIGYEYEDGPASIVSVTGQCTTDAHTDTSGASTAGNPGTSVEACATEWVACPAVTNGVLGPNWRLGPAGYATAPSLQTYFRRWQTGDPAGLPGLGDVVSSTADGDAGGSVGTVDVGVVNAALNIERSVPQLADNAVPVADQHERMRWPYIEAIGTKRWYAEGGLIFLAVPTDLYSGTSPVPSAGGPAYPGGTAEWHNRWRGQIDIKVVVTVQPVRWRLIYGRTTPPPLRWRQRDDGLGVGGGRRWRGASSRQRSLRQRGYRFEPSHA